MRRPSAVAALGVAVALFSAPRIRAQDTTFADLPPAGYGTLHQDDVALRLQTPTLQIRVVPLDERVTRLLAPDTYRSFHRLLESKAAEIDATARRYGIQVPTLFLVTFFGVQPQARFDPEIMTVISENRFFRPVAILPLSPLWSGQVLNQRETATAVYVFEEGIRLFTPFTLSYDGSTTDAWEQHLRALDRERASALARAAADRRP